MHLLQPVASSSLSLPASSYIYALSASSSSADGPLATISSDDSLRLFDSRSLQLVSVVSANTHEGVTSLKNYSGDASGHSQGLLATAGRDGAIRFWDARAGQGPGKAAVEMKTDNRSPILSLSCDAETNTVAAGTELVSSQAVVALWDVRLPKEIRHQFVESHNDDVTELQFHPIRKTVLLSGSTDGLVNIYDTTVTDEDDALLQVINHGSIHHAGFLSEDAVFALSHDEVFSIHPITNPDSDEANDPTPIQFGDLRQPLGCEYVVQTLTGTQGTYLAAGNTTDNRLDLFPITSNPKWDFDYNNVWRLPGAHGEEIVRTVYLDEKSRTIFSGGEDGYVRAWRPSDSQADDEGNQEMMQEEEEEEDPNHAKASARSKDKKKYKDEKRFKPY